MRTALKFALGVVVGATYVWCLVTVVIFMGFGQIEVKMCRDALKSSLEVAMHVTRGGLFLYGRSVRTM